MTKLFKVKFVVRTGNGRATKTETTTVQAPTPDAARRAVIDWVRADGNTATIQTVKKVNYGGPMN